MDSPTLVIIGCGNADRGDDAAGLLVARRLRELGIDAQERSGEALELIAAWTGAEEVILVDAVVTGATPGETMVWDGPRAPFTRETFRCSTHAFGLADAVELARVLGRLPKRLSVWGIEARQFEPGSAPSPEVLRAAEQVAERIAQEVAACMSPA